MEVFEIIDKNGPECQMDEKMLPADSFVSIQSERDIMAARQKAREASKMIGFSLLDQSRIITLISELARNIFNYADEGRIYINIVKGRGMKGLIIHAIDRGPGIRDVSQALEQGFSTSGSLGAGLPAVKRMADEFLIQTVPGKGTWVKITKWLN